MRRWPTTAPWSRCLACSPAFVIRTVTTTGGLLEGPPHPLFSTVAPFRAWRGSSCAVGGPTDANNRGAKLIAEGFRSVKPRGLEKGRFAFAGRSASSGRGSGRSDGRGRWRRRGAGDAGCGHRGLPRQVTTALLLPDFQRRLLRIRDGCAEQDHAHMPLSEVLVQHQVIDVGDVNVALHCCLRAPT